MKKYAFAFLLLMLLSLLTTAVHEQHAYNAATPSENGGNPAVSDANSNPRSPQSQNTKPDAKILEFAYGVWGWPGGITAWLLFLTLACIYDQTVATSRSAKATEDIVEQAERTSQMELRAYIVVTISGGSYQDREREIRFEGIPALANCGKTPAHNVRYRNNCAILTQDQAKTFSFPPGDEEIGGYVVGVGQAFTMSVVHREYCDSQDVRGIMTGEKAHFYTWGVVSYEDAFGKPQTTDFCHRLFFYQEKGSEIWKVNGSYIPGRNKAT